MAIRAVVFDIGGVLELTPDLGVAPQWEARLGLAAGEFGRRLAPVWAAGQVGMICLAEVHEQMASRLEISNAQVAELMSDVWREYLGSLNQPLVDYLAGLRPRYRTAILSNSFVGAREREQELYGFESLVDFIVYSHEVGMAKPDAGIYALTCDRLQVDPAEVVFVDDVPSNLEGARLVGMRAILHSGDNARTIMEIESALREPAA